MATTATRQPRQTVEPPDEAPFSTTAAFTVTVAGRSQLKFVRASLSFTTGRVAARGVQAPWRAIAR
jgi:hypothetical protein